MPDQGLNTLLGHIRKLTSFPGAADRTDQQLLEQFAEWRDEAAFELLVRRHGPMVLCTCRRVLHNEHDAEDAFQATFLVLARKAGAIRWRHSAGPWLYEVASRVARKARTAAARRRQCEGRIEPAHAAPTDCLTWRELRPFLLTRRGLTLSAVLFANLLCHNGVARAVPDALLTAVVRCAAPFAAGQVLTGVVPSSLVALAEGALKAMSITKLKFAALLILTAGVALLATPLVHRAPAEQRAARANRISVETKQTADAPRLAPRPPKPLDAVLAGWEKAMKATRTFSPHVTRTTHNHTFQTTEVFEGTIKYRKPNMASLHLTRKGKPKGYEKLIWNGGSLYAFVPQKKKIIIYEFPKPRQGQSKDNSFLVLFFGQPFGANFQSLLLGKRAEEARRRYELKLLQTPPNDQWYYYIQIKPKTDADKKDFTRARLVLSKATFLPRQVWYEQPSGNEVTWDFPKFVSGAVLERKEFAVPRLPVGWKFQRVPQDPTKD